MVCVGGDIRCHFFFFKQKTAYEMLRSLVGSEMCIRDSSAAMLKDAGAGHVIVGHSERRTDHGESNETVKALSLIHI